LGGGVAAIGQVKHNIDMRTAKIIHLQNSYFNLTTLGGGLTLIGFLVFFLAMILFIIPTQIIIGILVAAILIAGIFLLSLINK
jgi:hypothetical protein